MAKWSQKSGALPGEGQGDDETLARVGTAQSLDPHSLNLATARSFILLLLDELQKVQLQTFTSSTCSIGLEQPPPPAKLIALQYELARQYPGEYVIIDGPEVLFHSSERPEALTEYRRLVAERRGGDPRLIRPDAPSPPPEVRVRGRSAPSE